MNYWLRLLLVACVGVSLSSCIEFEREEIQYRHDVAADQLRLTLTYEGIFGGNSAPFANPDEAKEPPGSKELTAQSKEQMESVLKGGRAFFFNNWIFELNRSEIREILQKNKDANAEDTLTQPVKKFLHAILKDIELNNLGFYLDEGGRLCGTQTLVIKRFSNFLEDANEVIRTGVAQGIQEQRAKVEAGEKTPEDAPSEETSALWKKACSQGHDFLVMEKGRLIARVPLGIPEYLEFKKEILDETPNPEDPAAQNLPEEVSSTYRDKMLTLVLGKEDKGVVRLKKKCFTGYRDNALRYLREKHPKLLREKAKIETVAKQFLFGGD